MVQDFAKTQQATPGVDRAPANPAQPSALSLLFTGLITGLALGLFISFLVYISGALPVPPGQQDAVMASTREATSPVDEEAALTEELERAAARLQLEFYRELPNYEVIVDATPLDLPPSRQQQPVTEPDSTAASTEPADITVASPVPATIGGVYMIQAGAFQQQSSAQLQSERLLALGLEAHVKQEPLLGRTLYLVQSGPYSREQIAGVERILRNNNIDSMRITLGSR